MREIRQSMRRNRPPHIKLEALTEWHVKTRYSVAPFQGDYRCAGFTTTVTIRITIPRWSPPAGVEDSVKEAWDRYITALMEHEMGHAQFALSTAAELQRRVKEFAPEPDPDALKSRVQTMVQETIQEFKTREQEYDRLTQHGVAKGATLAPVKVR